MELTRATMRPFVFLRDRGVCATCGVDTVFLGRFFLSSVAPADGMPNELTALWLRSYGIPESVSFIRGADNWWDADHIVAELEGGATILENLRTLCIPCHRAATRELGARRRQRTLERRQREREDRLAKKNAPAVSLGLLTIEEVAERLGVCGKTVKRRIADEELPAIWLSSRTIRIHPKDLWRYLEGRQ